MHKLTQFSSDKKTTNSWTQMSIRKILKNNTLQNHWNLKNTFAIKYGKILHKYFIHTRSFKNLLRTHTHTHTHTQICGIFGLGAFSLPLSRWL